MAALGRAARLRRSLGHGRPPLGAGAQDPACRAVRSDRRRGHHLAPERIGGRQELGLPLHVGPGLVVHPRRPHQPGTARRGPRRPSRGCSAAIRDNGGDLHVFYTLDGTSPTRRRNSTSPAGGDSRPVRSGNSASGQTQLGTYGDLFDTIGRYCAEGHLIDAATGRLLADLADRCCDSGDARDSGIWELQDPPALHNLEDRLLGRTRPSRAASPRPARSRACTSSAGGPSAKRSEPGSTPTAGPTPNRPTPSTPARTTSMPPYSSPGAPASNAVRDWRRPSTPSAAELGRRTAPLPLQRHGRDEEGAFVACSFWMVDALVRIRTRTSEPAADGRNRRVGQRRRAAVRADRP